MLVNSDIIIENKPKDCKLCPKILCERLNSGLIYIYTNHRNDSTIYPPCVDKPDMFLLIKKGAPEQHIRFSSLLETIDSMLESTTCDLEEALQLTKIKNMICK